MKVLQLFNQYRSLFGGEETVVRRIAELVTKNGGDARLLMRSSRGLDESFRGRLKAFASGVYNPFAYRDVLDYLKGFRPDVAHVHNLYPLFSPSVLFALRREGIPVVMTVHNHSHTCPRADHLLRGKICDRCVGGREYHCVLHNCRENVFESFGYALRSAAARRLSFFTDNVSVVIALNHFAMDRLVLAGFDAQRVLVFPNMSDVSNTPADAPRGEFALFCGRMSPEKGVTTLLEAARSVPDIPIRLLGDGHSTTEYLVDAPTNATFLGLLNADGVAKAYRSARFLIVPSQCFEGSPLVVSEAMGHGIPVLASRIGGLPELVEDGVTGLLFDHRDPNELAQKMRLLWDDPVLCGTMGAAGFRKAEREFSEAVYWSRLKAAYDIAIRSNDDERRRGPLAAEPQT